MKHVLRAIGWVLILGLMAVSVALAQTASFAKDYLTELARAESQLIELGEAISEEVYSFRPTPEVWPLAQQYQHIASVNYGYLQRYVGLTPPVDPATLTSENYAARAAVLAAVKRSFDFVRENVEQHSAADFERQVGPSRNPVSLRAAYLRVLSHAYHHLGQIIVYARLNGVVPPWTARQQERQRQP